MCGIIGIIGREPVAPHLIDALKRLEYRGYDSAGVATLEHGVLTRRRAEGKLKNLEAAARGASRCRERSASAIPAGRPMAGRPRTTRIRTPPNGVAVVHNGIIENFSELRARARSQGRQVRDRDRHRGDRASRHRRDETAARRRSRRSPRRCRGCAARSRSPSCLPARRIC